MNTHEYERTVSHPNGSQVIMQVSERASDTLVSTHVPLPSSTNLASPAETAWKLNLSLSDLSSPSVSPPSAELSYTSSDRSDD